MRRKTLLVLVIMIVSILSTSCWNYRELNDYKIVSGMAVDFDELRNKYRLNVEIVNSTGEEQEINSEVFTNTGETLFQAIRDMIEKVGRKLYWSHAQTLIVSKEIAEKDIVSVLDFIYRDVEMRTNMWILISDEDTAHEIYDTDIKDTSKIISYHIDNILKNEASIGKYHSVEVWRFIKALYTKGVSPTAPLIGVTKQFDKNVPIVNGTAVFNGKKMVGTLSGNETKYLCLITDKLKGGIITVEPDFHNVDTLVALEVFGSKSKLKARYENEKIIIEIDSTLKVGIGETSYKVDLIGEPGRDYLTKYAEGSIKNRMYELITKVQKKYGADIFGFAPVIERDLPHIWDEIEGDWETVFKKLDFDIKVDVDIKGSALINSTLKVKE